MDLGLRNKTIVITGGASGIGAAIAHACAKEGAVPIILDRDQEAVERIERELTQDQARFHTILIELTDSERLAQVIDGAGREFGGIDGLVNNAGFNDRIGLENGTPELFAKSLELNLIHYYVAAEAALSWLKKSEGAIVNVSSKVAITGQGGTSGYAAAKGAILELTRFWAAEWEELGIRVNAVVPAEVATPHYDKLLKNLRDPATARRKIEESIPFARRFTTPDEVASTVIFLLRPSTRVTGQFLHPDGGYVHLDRAI